MKFTIEREKLLRMLESVSGRDFVEDFGDRKVSISACAPWVFAATEFEGGRGYDQALVLEEGTCVVRCGPLLEILESHPENANVTVEADAQSLRCFWTTVPVEDYSQSPTIAGVLQRIKSEGFMNYRR
jgi:hypothetical protein